MDKLQRICKERQVRFETFFEMFDKLKTKKISKGEFVRALSIAGISILPQEADDIAAKYTSPEFPDKICYLDLCDEVDSVFVRKNLETKPPTSPVSQTKVPRFHDYIGIKTEEDQNLVNTALSRLNSVASVNGLVVKDFFKDFDKVNSGSIPQEEFIRCMNQLDPSISMAQCFALARAYGWIHPNKAIMVSYRHLHDDVTDPNVPSSAMSRLTRDGLAYNEMVNPDASHWFQSAEICALEDQLSTYLAQYRISRSTASDHYIGDDRTRKGLISVSAFKRGSLRLFTSVAFTDTMLNALCECYAAPGDKVNYRDFVDNLFAKLGHTNVISRPNTTNIMTIRSGVGGVPLDLSSVHSSQSSVGSRSTVMIPERKSARRSILGNQLADTSHSMSTRSPIMISRNVRSGVMATAANDMKAAFNDTFAPTESGRSRPGTTGSKITGTVGGGIGDAVVGLTIDESLKVDALVYRIREDLASKRLDLAWKFHDFDTKGSSTSSRHDHVSATQFVRALVELNLLTVPPDHDALLLVKKYAPADGRHEPLRYVNYRRFLQDVDSSFQEGLHGGTLREDGESEITLGRPRIAPLRDQLEMLHIRPGTDIGGPDRSPSTILAFIANYCKTRDVRLTDFLKDGDPLRHGNISRHKFRTGLTSAGLRLSDREFDHLAARFDAGGRARDGGGKSYVAWKKLVDEVDDIIIKNDESLAEGDISFIYSVSSPTHAPQENNYMEDELVATTMADIAKACVMKRLDLRQSFQDFDKQKRGYVSSAVFDRTLALIGVRPSNPDKMRVLISKFAEQSLDSRVDVNYKAFSAAIKSIMDNETDPREVLNTAQYRATTATSKGARGNMSEYDNRTYVGPSPLVVSKRNGAVLTVLYDLVSQLKCKNGRLLDFFKDGDNLGGGELSHFKFRSALGRAGLLVDELMFAEIVSEFGSKKRRAEMIDWRRFHDALNEAKQEVNAADMTRSQANQTMEPFEASAYEAAVYTPQGGDPATNTNGFGDFGDVDEMEALLDAIARATTTKRLLMKPFFKDLDKCNANQVSKAQMGSVLSQNVGLTFSQKELDILFTAFCVYDLKGKPTDRFDYKKFIKRVDAVEIH